MLSTRALAGEVIADSFQSELLEQYSSRGGEVNYQIYLPDDYQTTSQAYPVIYLLHGSGGSETDWLTYGDVTTIADRLIRDGLLLPTLIVMPSDYKTRYTPAVLRPALYENLMANELIKHIDATYRTLQGRAKAIAGVSFGGYGAVYLTLSHPESYVAAASLSGPFWTTEVPDPFPRTSLLSFFFANPEQAAEFSVYNEIFMARALSTPPHIYLGCGDDDAFLSDNTALYDSLREANIAVTLDIQDGTHGWSFWRERVETVLLFLGEDLAEVVLETHHDSK